MKTARNVALLLLGLSAVMLLYGCTTSKNAGNDTGLTTITLKGTVLRVTAFNGESYHCYIIINADSGLEVSVMRKNLDLCERFKKGDKVTFSKSFIQNNVSYYEELQKEIK
ncbi:MAG: hypothetical protein AAB626_02085 [Patescibacteria group bacterium]